METIIISLLLLAIGLLLYLTATRGKNAKGIQSTKSATELPDIIGRPNPFGRHEMPTAANRSKNNKPVDEKSNFDHITELKTSEIPQEGPEEPPNVIPEWHEEEEELERYAVFSSNDGLATGVTFDELATMGRLLERKALEPSEKDIAVNMISRIDGTELLALLESRVGDTSKKIAMLLDMKLTGGG